MFIGHYAVGLAAKRLAPRVSLGTWFLAVQLVDLLWPLFLFLGLEHVRVDPGNTVFTPLDFYDYPFTHSLVGVIGWSVVLGGGYFLLRRTGKQTLLLAGAVLSHWILDFITHRPDLPLFPGGATKVGLGLWNWWPATVALEGSLFALGVSVYVRATRARDRTGSIGFWGLVSFLVLMWIGAAVGPPPPTESVVALSTLALWLLVPWAYWVDRHRLSVSLEISEAVPERR